MAEVLGDAVGGDELFNMLSVGLYASGTLPPQLLQPLCLLGRGDGHVYVRIVTVVKFHFVIDFVLEVLVPVLGDDSVRDRINLAHLDLDVGRMFDFANLFEDGLQLFVVAVDFGF